MTRNYNEMLAQYKKDPERFRPDSELLKLFENLDESDNDTLFRNVVVDVIGACHDNEEFNKEFGVVVMFKVFDWYQRVNGLVPYDDKLHAAKHLAKYVALTQFWAGQLPDTQRSGVNELMERFDTVRREYWSLD